MEQDKITVKMNFCVNTIMAHHVHIGGEFYLKPGQTEEQGWAEHIGRMEAFFKDNFPQSAVEAKGDMVTKDTSKQDEVIAKLYIGVEKKLNKFQFREDAQKYLDGTEFKMFAPARTIVNSLPLKNK